MHYIYTLKTIFDWMKEWIERCIQRDGKLSWECMSSRVKTTHHNEDTNLTQKGIDLLYGLKHKHAIIYIHP
jgi:hypothetical protein